MNSSYKVSKLPPSGSVVAKSESLPQLKIRTNQQTIAENVFLPVVRNERSFRSDISIDDSRSFESLGSKTSLVSK